MRRCLTGACRGALVCLSTVPFALVIPSVRDAYRAEHATAVVHPVAGSPPAAPVFRPSNQLQRTQR